eukprot:CAMPEP_0198144448 /NCGR_PEP_ID=MMETSP1443-20131203/15865_1 /TAXON_ID=186043 /ORGANISM="Entomoneis sp., Strain CCMP2396" /LENGTH=314 /DNA_ID=CAMNT_0043807849 /DNA_START=174 /DNA_END=1118 /DNA_ORIENTATION=+
MSFDEKIRQAIPAEIHMISGSADVQTSADVFDTGQFQLPNPAGKAGGACTAALLKVLYGMGREQELSWVKCLRQMRSELRQMGYDQVPQLTSSRLIDVNKTMNIVPPDFKPGQNRKRAILIGINYEGQQGQLSGCHNDVKNIKKFLTSVHGFNPDEMLILMDDGIHHAPTKKNIEDAFVRITQYSKEGDVVFVHYSGHGGRVVDTSGDEDDGYDETLVPVDFQRAGQIIDDDILKILVKPIKQGVYVTVLMDCCHSGTVLDLPYRFSADDSQMRVDKQFNMTSMMGKLGAAGDLVACACLGFCIANVIQDLMSM